MCSDMYNKHTHMKDFIINLLSNQDSTSISVKRTIGFLGFLILSTMLFISGLSKRVITPSSELIDAVQYITIAALFGNTAEKFTKKDPLTDSTQNQASE